MAHWIKGRQAPAMVIAIVALVAAVTGAAAAGPFAGSSISKKKTKAIATRVANSRIAALAPTLTVKSAETAGSMTMFGQVTSGGALTADSQGIGSVTVGTSAYYYCFRGLASTPKGGTATVDYKDSGDEYAQFGVGENANCPAGTQAFVVTLNDTGNGSPAGFFVQMWS